MRNRGRFLRGFCLLAVLTAAFVAGAADMTKLKIEVKNDILKFCNDALPRHKVPASISFVQKLDVGATGKLVRRQG